MATEEQIRKGLQELASRFGPQVSNIAKIKSVDEGKGTCVLIDEDDQEYVDVRLRPVLTGKESFIQVPKIGTQVLAIRIEDDDAWMVMAHDETEKFLWVTSTAKVEVSDKLHFAANGKSLIDLMDKLFNIIEVGYMTNSGATIELVNLAEFQVLKTEFKQLLK